MKKIFLAIFLILLLGLNSQPILAEDFALEVDFFYSQSCPFCMLEKAFLDGIKNNYPEVKFNYHEYEESENLKLLLSFYQKYQVPQAEWGRIPLTFVGEEYFLGFDSSQGRGQQIKDSIARQLEHRPPPESSGHQRLRLPFVGELDIGKYSLPVLAVILGALDGLNICSLQAVIFILSLVLALRSRKMTLILGGIFLFATAVAYGFLIYFWHQIFVLSAPWMKGMQLIIGLAAAVGGAFFLRQFWKFRKQGIYCDVKETQVYSRATSWIQESFTKSRNIVFLAASIIFFVAVITVIEFPCSAAVPLVFAGVLAEAKLPTYLSLFYLSIFLVFYLLDEIIVFLTAVFTMKIWLTSPRFLTWLNLVAAIFLFLLGGYYLIGF